MILCNAIFYCSTNSFVRGTFRRNTTLTERSSITTFGRSHKHITLFAHNDALRFQRLVFFFAHCRFGIIYKLLKRLKLSMQTPRSTCRLIFLTDLFIYFYFLFLFILFIFNRYALNADITRRTKEFDCMSCYCIEFIYIFLSLIGY